MERLTWPAAVRATVGVLVASFAAGTVLLLLLNTELTGAHPAQTGDFIRDVINGFEWDTARYPLAFASSALFAVGFAALGLLGLLINRFFEATDARRPMVIGSLVLAAGLGVAAQLMWIGARPVATSPQYCDCGLLAEEIMSRLMALDIASGVQQWLVNGAVVAAAIGLVIAARPGVRAGMPGAWAVLAYATAAVATIDVGLWALEVDPLDLAGQVLVAAVAVPAWAIWLAMRAETLRLEPATQE